LEILIRRVRRLTAAKDAGGSVIGKQSIKVRFLCGRQPVAEKMPIIDFNIFSASQCQLR
jgi:hypothetical protein